MGPPEITSRNPRGPQAQFELETKKAVNRVASPSITRQVIIQKDHVDCLLYAEGVFLVDVLPRRETF